MKKINFFRGLLVAGLVMLHLTVYSHGNFNIVKGEEISPLNETVVSMEQEKNENIYVEDIITFDDEVQDIRDYGGYESEKSETKENEMRIEETVNFSDESIVDMEKSINDETIVNITNITDCENIVDTDNNDTDVRNEESSVLQADFIMSVTEDIPEVKAGQFIGYEILLENTGDVNLESLELRSILDNGNMTGEWLETDGLMVDDLSGTATVTLLEAGQVKEFVFMVHIPEERQNHLDAEFFAKVENPLAKSNHTTIEAMNLGTETENSASLLYPEFLCKTVSLVTEIIPLKIDFTVKKWADRAMAIPGDTITYQICIRNTGERSLHSVLTTEKFQTAGLKAQFQEKNGVILNGAKTEALIAEIKPGEAYGLYATVTLPEDFEGGDILNEVTVVTRETGEQTFHAQTTVGVEKTVPTKIPVELPDEEQEISTNYNTIKEVPQTSDMSESEMWAGAFGISCLIIIGIYWIRKAKRKH